MNLCTNISKIHAITYASRSSRSRFIRFSSRTFHASYSSSSFSASEMTASQSSADCFSCSSSLFISCSTSCHRKQHVSTVEAKMNFMHLVIQNGKCSGGCLHSLGELSSTNCQKGPCTIRQRYPVPGTVLAGTGAGNGFEKIAGYPANWNRISGYP